MVVWVVSGVQGVFKLIKEENFNMNPLCWRDEGLSTHFPDNRTKYDWSSLWKLYAQRNMYEQYCTPYNSRVPYVQYIYTIWVAQNKKIQ